MLLIVQEEEDLVETLTYLLTPWIREANRFSGSQEIPRILWNQKVHNRIHKTIDMEMKDSTPITAYQRSTALELRR